MLKAWPLAILLALGSARAQFVPAPAVIERPATQQGSPVSKPQAQADYDDAVSRFDGYVASKSPGIKNGGNLPFLLTHGRKTAKSVLMVHGLTDSPYYMRSLADVFFEQGYNVVAVLLPGHGTKPEDLLHVKLSQWKGDVALGFATARALGSQVSLAGFSTGGALILDTFAKNEAAADRAEVGGLYFFSPALKIADPIVPAACQVPWLVTKFLPYTKTGRLPENQPYRYSNMAVNSVCQLYYLTVQNSRRSGAVRSAIASRDVPVFTVESGADKLVKVEPVTRFMKSLPSEVDSEYILYPKAAGVAHENVTRPELNPFYPALQAKLRAFLVRRAAVPAAPEPSATPAETFERYLALLEGAR